MRWKKRQIVVVGMMLLIAAAHIVGIGNYLPGDLYNFYYSYFSDFIMPFGFYFLFCMAEQSIPVLRHWQVKLGVTFLLPAIAETLQYFGVYTLGITFDPLDYVMYALGAACAAILDMQAFPRIIYNFGELRWVKDNSRMANKNLLPRQLTSFVGRRKELAEVHRLVCCGAPGHADRHGRLRQDAAGDAGGGGPCMRLRRWRLAAGAGSAQDQRCSPNWR